MCIRAYRALAFRDPVYQGVHIVQLLLGWHACSFCRNYRQYKAFRFRTERNGRAGSHPAARVSQVPAGAAGKDDVGEELRNCPTGPFPDEVAEREVGAASSALVMPPKVGPCRYGEQHDF